MFLPKVVLVVSPRCAIAAARNVGILTGTHLLLLLLLSVLGDGDNDVKV